MWEASSASGSLDHAVDDSEDFDDEEETTDSDSEPLQFSSSRRSSMHQDISPPIMDNNEQTVASGDAQGYAPPAPLVAWRDQLALQINQFQQSVANAFPNLPALPPMPPMPAIPAMPAMPALQDYQGQGMMRRITNLVPHRPAARDGWWDYLKGTSAPNPNQPPSYDELFPDPDATDESDMKKSSLLRAATEAAIDQHFEAQSSAAAAAAASASASTSLAQVENDDIKDITIGRNVISREQQKHLREQQARRMKGLGSDRNLYFIWVSNQHVHRLLFLSSTQLTPFLQIPLLILVICAWSRNYVPGIWQGVTDCFEFAKARYTQPAVEVGI